MVRSKSRIKKTLIIGLTSIIATAGVFTGLNFNKTISAEEIKATVQENLPGIVCWGDSLTWGASEDGQHPYSMRLYEKVNGEIIDGYNKNVGEQDKLDKVHVVNMGIGGETSVTILGRNGGIPFVINEDFKIPSGTTQTKIKFVSQIDGMEVAPLLQGSSGLDYVKIAGIKGRLTKSGNDYIFTRETAGTEVNVSKGEPIITSAFEGYYTKDEIVKPGYYTDGFTWDSTKNNLKDYIYVIFIGQNGGWSNDPATLIRQQKAIINNQVKNKDKFIIVGLHSGNRQYRRELETAMQKEYGDKYFNLREYLTMSNGVYRDYDLIKEDGTFNNYGKIIVDYNINNYLSSGTTPQCFLKDTVHFYTTAYDILGEQIYNRMTSLGYFDTVKTALNIG